MKRMIKVLLILAATVAAVAALAITAGATELKTGIGIVEANGGLRLRSQASTSSDVLSTAHNGDNVVVIRQVGNWYLVNYNLKIGYMHSDYITFKERARTSSWVTAPSIPISPISAAAVHFLRSC